MPSARAKHTRTTSSAGIPSWSDTMGATSTRVSTNPLMTWAGSARTIRVGSNVSVAARAPMKLGCVPRRSSAQIVAGRLWVPGGPHCRRRVSHLGFLRLSGAPVECGGRSRGH